MRLDTLQDWRDKPKWYKVAALSGIGIQVSKETL